MKISRFGLVLLLLSSCLAGVTGSPELQQDGEWSLRADSLTWMRGDAGLTEAQASGDVLLLSGVMSLSAASLTTRFDANGLRRVHASDHVRLLTPELDMRATEVYVDANEQGRVTRAALTTLNGRFRSLYARGDRASLEGDTLTVSDGWVTTCDEASPHFHLTAGRLTYDAGTGRIAARRASLYAGNTRLFTLPFISQSTHSSEGNTLPGVGYSPARGVSLRSGLSAVGRAGLWRSDIRVYSSDQTELQMAWSYRLGSQRRHEPLPSLQLGERRRTALVRIITDESAPYSGETGFAVIGMMNAPVDVRDAPASRLSGVDAAILHRRGTPAGSLLMDVRAGRLVEYPQGGWTDRVSGAVRWRAPSVRLGPQLMLENALEAHAASYAKGADSHWLCGETGIVWQASRLAKLSLGLTSASVQGTPPLLSEQLRVRRCLMTGIQLTGPTQFSVLSAYDLGRGRMEEAVIRMVINMHCLRPELQYNTRSRDIQVGLQLALD